jgi:hypothetical protein
VKLGEPFTFGEIVVFQATALPLKPGANLFQKDALDLSRRDVYLRGKSGSEVKINVPVESAREMQGKQFMVLLAEYREE